MDQFCRFLNNFDSFEHLLQKPIAIWTHFEKTAKVSYIIDVSDFSEEFWRFCSQFNENMQVGIPTVMDHFWRYFWKKKHVILIYCTSPDCLVPFVPHMECCSTWRIVPFGSHLEGTWVSQTHSASQTELAPLWGRITCLNVVSCVAEWQTRHCRTVCVWRACPTRSPGAHSHYYAYYTIRYHGDPFLRGLSR